MTLAAWRDRFGWLIMGAVVTATVISFILSYRGLRAWAAPHGYGGWAWVFPLCIDLFIIVGEAALFRAVHDRWTRWQMAPAWCAVGAGVVASVAGNAGVEWHSELATQVTRGVPPVTLAAMLALGLTVLKREMGPAKTEPGPEAEVAVERRPGRKSPPPPGAAPVRTRDRPVAGAAPIRARAVGCPHDGLPLGSTERIMALPDHFSQCLGRQPASNREMVSWAQAHWATIIKRANGQLAALK